MEFIYYTVRYMNDVVAPDPKIKGRVKRIVTGRAFDVVLPCGAVNGATV